MGFRNPFRITLDDDDVAYITDYSPDSQTPQVFRGPAGTGRMMVVREPANYGWPLCYQPDLPYYRWNFNTSTPLDDPPRGARVRQPDPRPGEHLALEHRPDLLAADHAVRAVVLLPGQQPDQPARHAVPAYYTQDPPGTCPQLFPELGTGGVGPHGAAKYDYDPANPNPTKFPRVLRRRDLLRRVHPRLPAGDPARRRDGDVFKINNLLNCGAGADHAQPDRSSATTRWT